MADVALGAHILPTGQWPCRRSNASVVELPSPFSSAEQPRAIRENRSMLPQTPHFPASDEDRTKFPEIALSGDRTRICRYTLASSEDNETRTIVQLGSVSCVSC